MGDERIAAIDELLAHCRAREYVVVIRREVYRRFISRMGPVMKRKRRRKKKAEKVSEDVARSAVGVSFSCVAR